MTTLKERSEVNMAQSFYLIVEPIDIIATDLGLSVQDYDVMATVRIAKTLEDALTILADHCSVHVAFLHADPVSFDETELGEALTLRNAQCVFMGDAAEHAKRAMVVLDRQLQHC
jgi:hypothetical protein